MKTTILFLILFFGFFVLPILGQTSVYEITVTSSLPFPSCERQPRPDGTVDVLIPTSATIRLGENTPSPRSEDGRYVFSFKANSVECRTTGTGYEIKVSDSGQPTSGGGTTQTVVKTAPPPDPNASTVTPAEKKNAEEDAKEVDFSIPESPGFTILRLTPQEVTRPATPREFAATIVNSLDRNGNFQSGIAIDTAPFQLLYPNTTRKNYIEKSVKGFFTRLAWRTQFSLATTKGTTEDDKSARLGAGLNMTFFDLGDPSSDEELATCQRDNDAVLRDEAHKVLGLPDGPQSDEEALKVAELMKTLITEKYLKNFENCSDDAEKRNFGKSSFGVGTAASWISKDGVSSKFTNNGQGLWVSLAYGFEKTGLRCSEEEIESEERCITPQLIFHFRRRVKETVPNPLTEGTFTTRDSNLFGMRLRVGVPKWSLNFEGVYNAGRYAGQTSSSNIQASVGADYRLAKNLYLNFSIGGETKESNIPNTGKVFVRTSFNWGTSQKPLQN